mmetsp:Transcript_47506/g.64675  ORF Transcript_47506/g.64675 Transcript_47506/m.64675 type:complete len:123 (-) Transcript_47506:383-751(-)
MLNNDPNFEKNWYSNRIVGTGLADFHRMMVQAHVDEDPFFKRKLSCVSLCLMLQSLSKPCSGLPSQLIMARASTYKNLAFYSSNFSLTGNPMGQYNHRINQMLHLLRRGQLPVSHQKESSGL